MTLKMTYAQKIRSNNIEQAKKILEKVRTDNPTLQEPDIKEIAIREIGKALVLGRRTTIEYYSMIT